jgi:hypothetical protein
MELTRRGASVAMIMMLAAGSALAQTVRTDYLKGTQFNNYQTFMWIKEPMAANPLNNKRIVDGVNTALTKKGLKLVTSDADLGLAAHTATDKEQSMHTFYDGFGGDWRWRDSFGSATTTVSTYTVGTLVIDIFDARSKEAVWRGTAMKTLSDNPQKVGESINKAIEKMFRAFPPASAASAR